MREYVHFLIDGKWVDPNGQEVQEVVNPATEDPCGRIAMGSAADVDRAVTAARNAFRNFSRTSPLERAALLESVAEQYSKRADDLALALTEELGAPAFLAQRAQVPMGLNHLTAAAAALKSYPFHEDRGATRIVKEPIGVCGLITPWNWPLNQITAKVAPALATGCTMILKPSEVAPFTGQIFAEIMQAAGVPAGVFNLVHGDGPGVGVELCKHPGIDLISFTGSTRAGIEVARNAATTIKRVHQELGGKSPNIVLDDEAFARGVSRGVISMMTNSGQTCSAPSRILVPMHRMEEASEIARRTAEEITVGDPTGNCKMGPVVSKAQFDKIQAMIAQGIDEGARLVTGGIGRPSDLERGFFVRPTVFADVTNDMVIAREEIFGPVLSMLGYESLDQAIAIANDTDYGLAAYVHGADLAKAQDIASQLRAGQVAINGAFDPNAPFGGYKMSGNGRECGDHAFADFLETKAVLGWAAR